MPEFEKDGERGASSESAAPVGEPVDRVEVETLRVKLHEQELATLRAVQAATELQTKLSSAQTEVVKIGQQYHGFSKQSGSFNARKAAEIAKLQSQWHNTQRELETQRRERRCEALRAAAKVSSLEKELEAVSLAVEPAVTEPAGKGRGIRRTMIAAVGVTAVIGLTFVSWRVLAAQNWQSADTPAPPAQVVAETAVKFVSPTSTATDSALALPSDSAAAFSMAVNRLDDALAAIPGRTPEDILQQASKSNKACRLQWNGGHPSLLFGGELSHANSLSATIDQCAEAVKHLH